MPVPKSSPCRCTPPTRLLFTGFCDVPKERALNAKASVFYFYFQIYVMRALLALFPIPQDEMKSPDAVSGTISEVLQNKNHQNQTKHTPVIFNTEEQKG